MSIAELATGSTVQKQSATVTRGNSFGAETTYVDSGSPLDCRAERLTARKSRARDGDGEARGYRIFFATNPGFTDGDRLKLTKIDGQTLSVAESLRVSGTEFDGSPDADLALWVVFADSSTRRSAGASDNEV